MAVLDKYADSNISGNVVNKLLTALAAGTGELFVMAQTYEIAAADDDTSVIRFFKSVPGTLVPIFIGVANDAITAGTDYDLGFYKPDLGAVIIKDCLLNGGDLSAAHALGLGSLNGMSAVDVANVGKKIYELAGHTITTRLEAYDIALTANTIGSAAGTVTVWGIFAQG